MDVVLNAADSYLLDGLYGKWAPQWDREALPRQAISVSLPESASERATASERVS
jgi:hypothetical protein